MYVEDITVTTVGRAEVSVERRQQGEIVGYATRLLKKRLENEPHDVIVASVAGLTLAQASAVGRALVTALTFTVEDESTEDKTPSF